jgi:hypothetical protein
MPLDQPPAIYAPVQTFQDNGPTLLIINGPKNKVLVTISMKDGSVTLGEGVKADDAAKEFWKDIQLAYGPLKCK